RKRLKALRAEYVAKFGSLTTSQEDAIIGAVIWFVRSRCLHRWARQPSRTDAECNHALTRAAECHDRYIGRLRSIGLARVSDTKGEGDVWATLTDDNGVAANRLPPSLLAEAENDQEAIEAPDATGATIDRTEPGQQP